MITIVDYGSGNIRAIGNIYEKLNIEYSVATTADQILAADKLILPGVGAFDETITMLNTNGFRNVLDKKVLHFGTPILGICVGMQMLADSSEEGKLPGLGWIHGRVKLFDKKDILGKPKIPHLGWNSISIKKESQIMYNIDEEEGFYFIHSYYFECAEEKEILSTTEYGKVFSSAIKRENIYGVQFHPEKSHKNGIQLLKNFAQL